MKTKDLPLIVLVVITLSFSLVSSLTPVRGTQPVSCGEAVTADTVLTADLFCPSDGLLVGSDNITLDCDGHTITGIGIGGSVGILSRNRKSVTVKDCVVQSFFEGIVFDSTTEGQVIGSEAYGNELNGFNVENSSNITISNNTAYDNVHGFRLYRSHNNTVLSNVSWNNSNYGFLVTYGSDNNLTLNTALTNRIDGFVLGQSSDYFLLSNQAARNQGSGFNLDMLNSSAILSNVALNNTFGFALSQSFNNSLSNNEGTSNSYAGFLLFPAANNTLASNLATQNLVGIHLQLSVNNTLSSNTVSYNELGLRLLNSTGNLVCNNHLDNIANALDNAVNSWNTTKTTQTNIIGGPFLGGNYWSDYHGQDYDGDGLGDTILPHNSTGGIQYGGDNNPLVPPPSPDFDIIAAPGTVTVKVGSPRTSTVTLVAKYGFRGTVTVVATVTPDSGLVVSCAPDSASLETAASLACLLTPVKPGTYNIILTGTSDSMSHSVTIAVLVETVPSINPNPATIFGLQPFQAYVTTTILGSVVVATAAGFFISRARCRRSRNPPV